MRLSYRDECSGVSVKCLGSRVWGSGLVHLSKLHPNLCVCNVGMSVWEFGSSAWNLGLRVQNSGIRIKRLGIRVQGLEFEV